MKLVNVQRAKRTVAAVLTTQRGLVKFGNAEWWILKSTGGITAVQFGGVGDKAVAGDYTGDGKADIAIFRPSNGF